MNFLPCAGVIVFDKELKKCVLVKTEKNNYGFPKGKRHKGETFEQTALREMEEETGLKKDNLLFIENFSIDELNRKGNQCTKYLVAKCVFQIDKFFYDTQELAEVKWYEINEATQLLRDTRKTVLNKAVTELAKDNINFKSL